MIKLAAVEACITPDTELTSGKLHKRLVIHKDSGDVYAEDVVVTALNTEAYECVDCFCAVGKLLNCAGVSATELDEVDEIFQNFHGQSSHEHYLNEIWARWGKILEEQYGIRLDLLRDIIQKNDNYYTATMTHRELLRRRAKNVVSFFRSLTDGLPA